MAKIRIVGDSSGYVELAAPNAAGNNTLELPASGTKLVGADASNNLNVTGIATFSGGIVGNLTGNATGLSGTPNITVGSIIASSATISGNVSIAGTVTYEDVTNVDSIGIVTARSGVVIGTGASVSSPETNVLTLGTNNSERVRITGIGSVGIGLINPSTIFHIRQPADYNGITISHATRIGKWRLEHSGTNSENFVFIQNNGTSDANTYVVGRDLHYWYTNNVERMSLTSSGNLGIGTAPTERAHVYSSGDVKLLVETPSSGVNANSALYLKTASEGNWLLQTGNAVSGGLRIYDATAGAERIRVSAGGSFGVGTDSPDTNIHIQRSATQNDNHGIIKVESTNSTSGAATNSSLIVKNKYGWSQFMQWENYGLRVGSRNITGGSSGGIYFTYGADNEGIILDSSGRVRMPSQPSGAWQLTVNGSGVRSILIKKNTGNHVSSVPGGNGSTHGSVGRFTAPVNGAYLISLFSTAVGASSQCLMSVYGSWTSGTNNVAVGAEVFDCRNTRPPEDGGGWSQVFYFNATDYWEIDWYRPTPTSYIDSVMTMNVTVHLLG